MFLLLVACSNDTNKDSKITVDTTTPGEYTYITLFDATQKFENGDEFIVAFTQDLCGYCEEFDYFYDEYRKDHSLNIYNVNLSEENRSEQENLEIILEYWPTFYNTPGIYYCKDGEVVSSLTDGISYMDLTLIESWVEAYDLLTIPK